MDLSNPLVVPETHGGTSGAAIVFYAVGEPAVLGFSPFAVDDFAERTTERDASYRAIATIVPTLLEQQSKAMSTDSLSRENVRRYE